MKNNPVSNFIKYYNVHRYRHQSKVHWKPREDPISYFMKLIKNESGNKTYRVVDIGCGPGLLVNLVKKMDFEYYGIDNDEANIQYCIEKYSWKNQVTFSNLDVTEASLNFSEQDIIVLNGVAHHLDEFQINTILEKSGRGAALIICDHLKKEQKGRIKWLFPQLLQDLDRGKFVRHYSFFENLTNYTLLYEKIFPIGIAGITLWMHFCNYYKHKTS